MQHAAQLPHLATAAAAAAPVHLHLRHASLWASAWRNRLERFISVQSYAPQSMQLDCVTAQGQPPAEYCQAGQVVLEGVPISCCEISARP